MSAPENTASPQAEPEKTPFSSQLALRTGFHSALMMALFTLGFTALMALTYQNTHELIESANNTAKIQMISAVLPVSLYNNNLLNDSVNLPPTPALGLPKGGKVYRARQNGQPAALVFEAAAPDGYAGRIDLIVALDAQNTIVGVRTTHHNETPGLGDYIDPLKDKNKAHPWVEQFAGHNLDRTPLAQWTVKKDGGVFDYRTGATISARAISKASARVVQFATAHHAALFEAPVGTVLSLEAKP